VAERLHQATLAEWQSGWSSHSGRRSGKSGWTSHSATATQPLSHSDALVRVAGPATQPLSYLEWLSG